jgi:branched-chain amino acid transport system ATP-binding protein
MTAVGVGPEAPRRERPKLSCRGISKNFGGLKALDGVTLDFRHGEVLALVGPNGAGKSTLIDVLTGFVRADSGLVQLGDERLGGRAWRRARRGQMRRTFQHPKLARNLSMEENVVIGTLGLECGSARGVALSLVRPAWGNRIRAARSTSTAAFEQLGLASDHATATLSVGEQRLTELARALGGNPDIVFFDEPFAGADAAGMERMGAAIRALADAGTAVIVVDHHVDVLADLADRMVLMFQGAIVFDGEPHEGLRSRQMRVVYFGESDE